MNAQEIAYTIELERGEDKCQNCGAFIRNIVRVNGVPFGTECARKFYPRTPRTVKAFEVALLSQQANQNEAIKAAILGYVQSQIVGLNSNDEFISQRVASTLQRNSPKYLAWLAYQQVRAI